MRQLLSLARDRKTERRRQGKRQAASASPCAVSSRTASGPTRATRR